MRVHLTKLLLLSGAVAALFSTTNLLVAVANCICDCTETTAVHYNVTNRWTYSSPIAAADIWSNAANSHTQPAGSIRSVRTVWDVWWTGCEDGCPTPFLYPCAPGNYGDVKGKVVKPEGNYYERCIADSD